MGDVALLLLISWNLPWGPSDDEYRRNQLDEAMKHFYAINTEENPLYQNHCFGIAQDLEDAGIVTFPRGRPLEEDVFEYVKSQSLLAKTDRRTSNCRFGGTLVSAIYNLPLWGMQTSQRQYTALKPGHLSHKKDFGEAHSQIQGSE